MCIVLRSSEKNTVNLEDSVSWVNALVRRDARGQKGDGVGVFRKHPELVEMSVAKQLKSQNSTETLNNSTKFVSPASLKKIK